jgi:hypothetical protein
MLRTNTGVTHAPFTNQCWKIKLLGRTYLFILSNPTSAVVLNAHMKEYMDNPRIPNLDNIQKAAVYFVEKMLHVSPTDKDYRNAKFLL